MSVHILKWLLPLLVVIVAVTACSTHKTFDVEIMIPAPPSAVWAVLTETERYPEWNPVFVEVEGPYREGGKVLNRVQDPEGKILEMTATVKTLTPERELRQTGGIPGLLTFDHQWLLEPVEGGTKVRQHEIDRGLWLWFWDSSWIIPSYTKTLEALKARVHEIQQQ